MYSEYLGVNYHDTIRSMLKAKRDILPDAVIDSELNIGAMRMILNDSLFVPLATGRIEMNEANFATVRNAALHTLAGILCASLDSKTRVPEFKEHRRNWNRIGQKQFQKARLYIESLPTT